MAFNGRSEEMGASSNPWNSLYPASDHHHGPSFNSGAPNTPLQNYQLFSPTTPEGQQGQHDIRGWRPFGGSACSQSRFDQSSENDLNFVETNHVLNILRQHQNDPFQLIYLASDKEVFKKLLIHLEKYLVRISPPSSPTKIPEKSPPPSPLSTYNASRSIGQNFDGSEVKVNAEVKVLWNGELPSSYHPNMTSPVFSAKIFIGGLRSDCNLEMLQREFEIFGRGQLQIDLPDKPLRTKRHAYLTFSDNCKVNNLLEVCDSETAGDKTTWYYSLKKEHGICEIIPWLVSDNAYYKNTNDEYHSNFTVFVGGVYGKITAKGLADIMEDLFGETLSVCLDTDRYKYPRGSARVRFIKKEACMNAIASHKVEIKTLEFTKVIEIQPYIDDLADCGEFECSEKSAFLCKKCFKYCCKLCKEKYHRDHEMLSRKTKSTNYDTGSTGGSPRRR